MNVIIDTSAIDYYRVMNADNLFEKENIEELVHTNGFTNFIYFESENVGLENGDFKTWLNVFNVAMNVTDDVEVDDFYQYYMAKAINDFYLGYNESINKCEKVIDIIKTLEFIPITKKYLPENIDIKEVEIYIVFGINNCFSYDNKMFLDGYFLSNYSKETIVSIVAHELHHIFRSNISKDYMKNRKNDCLYQGLFWFESEGIADLCNGFINTIPLYLDNGVVEEKLICDVLENPKNYFREYERLLLTDINNNSPTSASKVYLNKNIMYHILAYCMTKQIIDTYELDELNKCVGDMVRFFELYNNASKEKETINSYVFSEEVMKEVEKMKK